jgi:hypothetical protein
MNEVGRLQPAQRFARIKEMVMAKVIEFYLPSIFRKTSKGPSWKRCGKVIEFCRQTRKSAASS